MQLNKTIIYTVIITSTILLGVGLGLYFGLFYEPTDNAVEDKIVLTVIGNENTENYTLAEIKTFENYTGYGGTKNDYGTIRNYNLYRGVLVSTLLDQIGGMTNDYALRVTSSDSYVQDYFYFVVNGNVTTFDNQTGEDLGYNIVNMVLIYEIVDEGPITDGPLRVAFLSPEGYLTEASLWAKLVVKLQLIGV